MSWFETAGFTSLARTAWKEAQRKIDSALDIKEEDLSLQPSSCLTTAKLKEESDSFFAEFGISDEKEKPNNVCNSEKSMQAETVMSVPSVPAKSAMTSNSKVLGTGELASTMATSLWGSFAGSFFEEPSTSTSTSDKVMVEASNINTARSVVAAQPQHTQPAHSSTEPYEDESRSTEPCKDESRSAEPCKDESRSAEPYKDESRFIEPYKDESQSRVKSKHKKDVCSVNKQNGPPDKSKLPQSFSTESFKSIFSSISILPADYLKKDNSNFADISTEAVANAESITEQTVSCKISEEETLVPLVSSSSFPLETDGTKTESQSGAEWGWGWDSIVMLTSVEGDQHAGRKGNAISMEESECEGALLDELEDSNSFSNSQLVVADEDRLSGFQTESTVVEDSSELLSITGLCPKEMNKEQMLVDGEKSFPPDTSEDVEKHLGAEVGCIGEYVQSRGGSNIITNDDIKKNFNLSTICKNNPLPLLMDVTEQGSVISCDNKLDLSLDLGSKTCVETNTASAIMISTSISQQIHTSPLSPVLSQGLLDTSPESIAVLSSSGGVTSSSVEVLCESSSSSLPSDTSPTAPLVRHETVSSDENDPLSAAGSSQENELSSTSPLLVDNFKTSIKLLENKVPVNKVDGIGSELSPNQRIPMYLPNITYRNDVPLTVQPSKSPLKIAAMTTVIDSQSTLSDRRPSSGDKWGSHSSQEGDDSDTSDNNYDKVSAKETLIESLGTITRQPVSRLVPQESTSCSSCDSQKWDSFSEDVSASDSIQSTSSSHTVIESGLFSHEMLSLQDIDGVSKSEAGLSKSKHGKEEINIRERSNDESDVDQTPLGDSSHNFIAAELSSVVKRDLESFKSFSSSSHENPIFTGSSRSHIVESDCICISQSEDSTETKAIVNQVQSQSVTTEDVSNTEQSVFGTISSECITVSPACAAGPSVCTIEPSVSTVQSVSAIELSVCTAESSTCAHSSVLSTESLPWASSSSLSTGAVLPQCAPLDVSVESGGSSDTITASMELTHPLPLSSNEGEGDDYAEKEVERGLIEDCLGGVGKCSSAEDGSGYAGFDNISEMSRNDSCYNETRSLKTDECGDKFVPHLLQEAMGDEVGVGPAISSSISESNDAVAVEGCSSVQNVFSKTGDKKDGKRVKDVTAETGSASSKQLPDSERENSPSSSDSLMSEMVKIGSSEHTSGHTSGDEFETTTSSDIEVISSPSLDGVSVYSGQGSGGGVALLVPAHNTAARVWHSAQQRFKALLVEPGHVGGSLSGAAAASGSKHVQPPNGMNPQDRSDVAISPSLTASFTSISESDGNGMGEAWGTGGGGSSSSSPPHCRPKKQEACGGSGGGASHHYFERGHTRNQSNMSETSESSSEPNTPDLEKLNKRVSQLSETLEVRELRLLELSQQNVALQDSCLTLQQRVHDLESGVGGAGGGGEEGAAVEAVREEYTQRLAGMERRLQQALREREASARVLEAAKADFATRLSSSEVRLQLEERDTVIAELRSEGEKLSKQQLQYSNSIKKLRAKEKEAEATLVSQSAKINAQNAEIERQHRQLMAKGEVERRQVAAVTQLTADLQRVQLEAKAAAAEQAETESKLTVLREALDAAYREISEAKRLESTRAAEQAKLSLSAEVGARQAVQQAMQEWQQQADREREALLLQLQEERDDRDRMQQQADRTESLLRAELLAAQQQVSASEHRGEQLASSVAAATRPLLRQIEALQGSHAQHRQTWEEAEAALWGRVEEAEQRATESSARERSVREQSSQALAITTAAQAQVETLRTECSSMAAKVHNLSASVSRLEEEKESMARDHATASSQLKCELSLFKAEAERLRLQVDTEKQAAEGFRMKIEVLEKAAAEGGKKGGGADGELCSVSRQSSPTPSLSRLSIAGSVSSYMAHPWPDDVFDTGSVVWGGGRVGGSLYEALRGGTNTATTVEALTSQLTQREGELQQLRGEVIRHEAQRESLATELQQLTEQLLQLQETQEHHEQLRQQHQDTEQKYNALLQMYGEKVEEVEELRLDLADVKEMYKAQINQLMQK